MSTNISEVSLRVLYTVNTSPQYILAKAPHKIPFVSADGSAPSSSLVKYGRAPVKACAIAICRSSPELRPDTTKDFSVYILDPLEDLLSKSRHGQSGGVAVGMGLLSNILSPYTSDTIMVTGTFVGCGQDEDALEVVISLRQVAPPVIHVIDSQSRSASSLTKGKASLKHSGKDRPCFTSRPLPLPSLDDRLFACYTQPKQCETQRVLPKESRKPNPTHSTRAHQLPTPYIGPQKRKYLRETERGKGEAGDGSSGNDSGTEPTKLQPSPVSEDAYNDKSSDPATSDTLTSNGQPVASKAPDLSDAAVMLAALSSVSSKPTEGEVSLPAQANIAPSPELVSFLRAYLAYIETPIQPSEDPTTASSTSQISEPPADPGPKLSSGLGNESNLYTLEDKENQRPLPAVQSSKETHAKVSEHCLPLGSGHYNTRSSDNPTLKMTASDATASSSAPKKRKLSDVAVSEQNFPDKRRSSSIPVEDLSGIRQNRGWGGLRVRSDGTLWGEQPPKATSYSASSALSRTSSDQPVFFRSSGQIAPVPVRKGPYIVPDWAKGVPPPAPPPKSDVSNEGKDQPARTTKRLSKTKSLGRLGGRGNMKRDCSFIKEPDTSNRLASSMQCSPKESSTNRSSHFPDRHSPGKPPIFAYSSPVGKSRMTSLFQAFQTSPCRPASIRKALPSTPSGPAKTLPGVSMKRSSLFTPSPTTKTATGTRLTTCNLSEGEELPPSPTPMRKCSMTPKGLARRMGAELSASLESPHDIHEESHCDLPSSLPIASSDDALDDSSALQTPTISSDSTITSFSKVHDWSSLDLPPSSPPPPSSPSIDPLEGSDLPCSDISCDVSEVESPSFASDLSNHPSPSDNDGQRLLEITGVNMDFGMHPIAPEDTGVPFLADTCPSFNLDGERGPSALAAFEALRNGLGQEDFSEGWNFLNSLFDQFPTDANTDLEIVNGDGPVEAQNQSWITDNASAAPLVDFDAFFSTETDKDGPNFESLDAEDRANTIATNFKGLLEGCLV